MTNYRHINRGDIKEGGCPLCKPRMSRNANWTKAYFDEPHRDSYHFEEVAEADATGLEELDNWQDSW